MKQFCLFFSIILLFLKGPIPYTAKAETFSFRISQGGNRVVSEGFLPVRSVWRDKSIMMEPPKGQFLYHYVKISNPIISNAPGNCRPVALDLASGILDLKVALSGFSDAVDVLLAVYAPSLANDLFLFGPDGLLYPSFQGIRIWKQGIQEGVDESPLNGLSISFLPAGIYKFFLMVTPSGEIASGSLDDFYLWSTGFVIGICQKIVDMNLNIDNVASAPAVFEKDGLFFMGTVGEETASILASQYKSTWTFCDVILGTNSAQVLQNAKDLLDAGDVQGAVMLIFNQLNSERHASSILRQAQEGGWRGEIRAALEFYEELTLMGETEQAEKVLKTIQDYFQENAKNELEAADFEKSLRVCEEAILLGVKTIEELARNRIKRLLKENLENVLNEFDPCTNDPDALDQKIKRLLNSLYAAQFFGVEEVFGLGEDLYAKVAANLERAVRIYNNLKQGMGPGPDCGLGMDFELEGASGYATMKANIHSCSGITGSWNGSISIDFVAPGAFSCKSSGQIVFTVDPDTLKAEGVFQMSDTHCWFPDGLGCYFDYATESIWYKILFLEGGRSAQIAMSSSGQGSASITCCDDSCKTFTYPVWTIFWGGDANTMTVPVKPYVGCGE